MGRDHTIFAQETGYVKYYTDPEKHPKRKYIGVVFEGDVLPAEKCGEEEEVQDVGSCEGRGDCGGGGRDVREGVRGERRLRK
jgi:hypothetical protein